MDENYKIPEEVADWVKAIGCAVTICDTDGRILYMNDRARLTYIKHGNLIGHNLFACHNERSQAIIRRLLENGGTNTYTVTKNLCLPTCRTTTATNSDRTTNRASTGHSG